MESKYYVLCREYREKLCKEGKWRDCRQARMKDNFKKEILSNLIFSPLEPLLPSHSPISKLFEKINIIWVIKLNLIRFDADNILK